MLLALFKHSLRCCFICYNLLIYFIYLFLLLSLFFSPSLYMQHCKVPFHFALPDCCIYLKFVAVAAFLISPQPFHARPPACIYPFIYLWYLHTHTSNTHADKTIYHICCVCVCECDTVSLSLALIRGPQSCFFFFGQTCVCCCRPLGKG